MIVSQELLLSLEPGIHVLVALQHHRLVKTLGEALEQGPQLFTGILCTDTQLQGNIIICRISGRARHSYKVGERLDRLYSNKCTPKPTYVSIKLKEDLIVVVVPQDRVRCQSLEEDLMHGHRLLERGQVLTRTVPGQESNNELMGMYIWESSC